MVVHSFILVEKGFMRGDVYKRQVSNSAGISSKPLGYNIVNWIRDNMLWKFKDLNPIGQVKNLLNVYNDKTHAKILDLDISDNLGCGDNNNQDGLLYKLSIIQSINDQMSKLEEAKMAPTKLLRELHQQLNSAEEESKYEQ